MSESVIRQLEERARIIRDEYVDHQNTALRVGSLFLDTLEYIESISGGSQGEKTLVTVTPKYSGGTEVAVINVDNTRTSLWAPSPTTPTPYDDAWIRGNFDSVNETLSDFHNALAVARETIDTENARLNGVIADINDRINDKINGLEREAEWIQNMFPEHKVSWQSGWDDEVGAYLQKVGVWARNNGITETQWSNISQKVDSLELSVNNTREYVSGKVAALSASVTQQVTDYVASLRLDTSYAKKDATEKIIEWMYSAIKSESSAATTFNQIYSAGQSGMNSAIAEIRTQVDKLDNGDYIATADMETKVNDSISGLYQRATATESETNLFSQVKYEKGKIQTWNNAGVILRTNMDDALATMYAEGTQTRAGVILKSTLNKSVASLIATGANDTKAAIQAMVDDGVSQVTITADKLNAVTKDTTLQTAGIEIKAGNWDPTSGREILIEGDSAGTLKMLSKYMKLADNSDGGSCRIDFDKVYINTGSGGDIFIGRSDDLGEGDIFIGTGNAYTYFTGDLVVQSSSIKAENPLKVSGSNIELSTSEGGGKINLKDDALYLTGVKLKGTVNANTISSYSSAQDDSLQLKATSMMVIRSGDNITLTSTDGNIQLNTNQQNGNISLTTSLFKGNVPYTESSDERLKNIQAELNPNIEDIANARIVNYTLKSKESEREFLGSIAQDWQDVLPNAVSKDKEGYLGLDYGSAALASAVTAAREIVALKEENKLLKERIERLERLIEAK